MNTNLIITDNVKNAMKNFILWLTWFPGDYEGAMTFAGDQLDTVDEVDRLQELLEKVQEA